jgi:hypothetical protein
MSESNDLLKKAEEAAKAATKAATDTLGDGGPPPGPPVPLPPEKWSTMMDALPLPTLPSYAGYDPQLGKAVWITV